MADLYQTIQQVARNVLEAGQPMEIVFGTVQSLDPFLIRLSQKLSLGTSFFVVKDGVSVSSFALGDRLILFRFSGGQKYLIYDKEGEW